MIKLCESKSLCNIKVTLDHSFLSNKQGEDIAS